MTPKHRDLILSAVYRYNKTSPKGMLSSLDLGILGERKLIYVAENLSPETKHLHMEARKASRVLNFKYNVNRFKTKLYDFYINVLNNNYDVICLIETNLNSSIRDNEFLDDRYNIFRRDRDVNTSHKITGGGVFIAMKKCFVANRVPDSECNVKCIWLNLVTKSDDKHKTINIKLGLEYLPPDLSIEKLKMFNHKTNDIPSNADESLIL
ncbi:unnamed protein product, partial [Leptidea sinapis]